VIRILLPPHLQALAKIEGEVLLDLRSEATLERVLTRLESEFPMLKGTIRDHLTGERRSFVRFIACHKDISHQPPEDRLPPAVAGGTEPLLIIGALAGG
jgi:hypothetical protein